MDTTEKYYVYMLVDPRCRTPFYVGKGCGLRAFTHLNFTSGCDNISKDREILKIRSEGVEPRVQFLFKNVCEESAFRTETMMITSYGRRGVDHGGMLTNLTLGSHVPSQLFLRPEEKMKWSIERNDAFRHECFNALNYVIGRKEEYQSATMNILPRWLFDNLSKEEKQTIRDHNIKTLSERAKGPENGNSRWYQITSPDKEEYVICTLREVKNFCSESKINYYAFHNKLYGSKKFRVFPFRKDHPNFGWSVAKLNGVV